MGTMKEIQEISENRMKGKEVSNEKTSVLRIKSMMSSV